MQKQFYAIKVLLGFFLAFCSSTIASAQLNITPNATATQLVDKLVGSGVITFNPSLSCKLDCSGTFAGLSNLGIDSGILLVTGNAKTNGTIIGVDAPATSSMSTQTTVSGTDADLGAIASPYTHNNDCILQFQFIPAGDTVKFEYVFGSEEYPEYACTQFNDVFAFLISGPGIVPNTTGITTKRNIALVPGTTNIPVAINSINSGVGGGAVSTCANQYAGAPYTQFYVNNLSPAGTTVVFDGFTTVLTARQNVTPCDTYTLKMAICDVSDGSFNSGVFIKAGSLNSVTLASSASGMEDTTVVSGHDSAYIVRGCPPATVTLSRESPGPNALNVPYVLTGTAVNGVDYQFLNGILVIPANATSGSIQVKALPLTVPGPNKFVKVKFLSPYNCGTSLDFIDSSTVFIQDSLKILADVGDTSICFGQNLEINFVTDTIFGTLNYTWVPNSGITSPTINFSNIIFPQPGIYNYQYKINIPSQDTNCRVSTATFQIKVQDIKVNIGSDTSICSYDRLQMFAEAFPQDTGSSYQYNWTPANYFDNPNIVAPVIQPGHQSSNIILNVVTDIGCTGRDTMILTVNPGEFIGVLPADTGICPGQVVIPAIFSTLPNTPLQNNYTYHWTPEFRLPNPLTKNQQLSPEMTTQYRLVATNEFGCFDTSFVNIVMHSNAVAQMPDSIVMWLGEQYQLSPLTNAVHFNWFPVSGIDNPSLSNPTFSPIVNTRYFYTATTDEGCSIQDSIDVIVRQDGVFDMPNAFDPNSSLLKPLFRGNFTLQTFEIYDRWGKKVYESKDINQGWDGKLNGIPQPLGVYVYVIKLRSASAALPIQKTGNVSLIR